MATNEDTIVVGAGNAQQNSNTAPRQTTPPRPNTAPRPQQNVQRPAFQPIQSNDDQTWKRVLLGGVAGIMFGSVSAVGATAAYQHFSSNGEEEELDIIPEDGVEVVNDDGHYMLDNGLMVAEIDQSMSFGEAFAAAREEVGPGGVFVWHGNVYSTHLEDEWNAMSPSERNEFTHMSLSALNGSNSYTANDNVDVVYHHHDVHVHVDTDDDVSIIEGDDDVQIVGGDPGNGEIADLGGGDDDIYMINVDDEGTLDPGGDGLIADNTIGVGEDGMPDYANDVPGDILV